MTVAKGQLVLHGYHVRQVGKDKTGKPIELTEPISYPVDWTDMEAGGVLPKVVKTEGDRDFMLTHITHNQSDSGFIPLRVQIGQQNGINLFRDACYINTISSTNAGQPFKVGKPRLFIRSNPIKVDFSVDV